MNLILLCTHINGGGGISTMVFDIISAANITVTS